jgi:hypothetical protein
MKFEVPIPGLQEIDMFGAGPTAAVGMGDKERASKDRIASRSSGDARLNHDSDGE